MKKPQKQLIPRWRIPLVDPIFDACRFLPLPFQSIAYFFFMAAIQFLPAVLYFGVGKYVILAIPLFFLLALIFKYITYLRISKIEQAIRHQVIWIKTEKDQALIMRYWLVGLLLSVAAYFLYQIRPNSFSLLMLGLICLLFFLKALFYVPGLYFCLIEDDSFQIVNEYKEKELTFKAAMIKQIKIDDYLVKINGKVKDDNLEFEVRFNKKRERIRLRLFLARVLKPYGVVVE
ncbi:MAG: hypothetical protein AAFP19_08020 [Bacteroidota bacterium]